MRSFCTAASYAFASSLTSKVEPLITASSAAVSSWLRSFFSFCARSWLLISARYASTVVCALFVVFATHSSVNSGCDFS